VLGVLNGLWKPAETFLDSTLQMVRNIPHLALIPLVILWFGIDEAAKLFLVSIGVSFRSTINTFHGVRTIDHQLVENGGRLRPRPQGADPADHSCPAPCRPCWWACAMRSASCGSL
jgi:ABC-type nitrate/sulfonate/bicarbonate transport system permease component